MNVIILCSDCKKTMLESKDMTADEIRSAWTNLILTAPLNVGKCKNGCRATYSDCNMNTEMKIKNDSGELIEYEDLLKQYGNAKEM